MKISSTRATFAHILIVDDTSDNIQVLSAMLIAQGYEVCKAINGPMALSCIEKKIPDVILIDIMMPGMNGYEVCRTLKSARHTQDIPVIFLSALDDAKDKIAAFEAGGVDYITKPFQLQEVLVRVRTQVTLRAQQKQLQANNIRLEREIHDRLKAEAALQSLNRDLETQVRSRTAQLIALQTDLRQALAREHELNMLKDEFLSNISHELRTPLNSIIGFLHLVLDGFCEERSEELEMLQHADTSAMHLLTSIESMLDIVSIKRGQLSVACKIINLRDCVQNAIAARMPQIQEKGLQISYFDPEKSLFYVKADPEKLEQALVHILDNAVKFTDAGQIDITSWVQPGSESEEHFIPPQVMVRVRDTGIGIEPDIAPKLFQPFTMEDSSSTRVRGGNGLGLTLAQSFVELMGGQISMTSEGKGKGTEVTIALPLCCN
ncbi:MAG: hybrid sensor histidine kinase/response regulator [Cyanobacteriota bacterium]|nr:hybrid sensor histidine kinase/response regulator [Cyanobacteriota bacterium]